MRIMGRQNAHYKVCLRFVTCFYVFLRVVQVDVVSKKSPKATCWGGEKHTHVFLTFLMYLGFLTPGDN